MKSTFDYLLTILLQGILVLSASYIKVDISKVDNHLQKYDKYNITHHDNIDDSVTSHKHTHRHSKDGQEHEHHHEHIKITQYEVLKYHEDMVIILNRNESIKSLPKFYNNNHFSTAHLPEIFRPPIA